MPRLSRDELAPLLPHGGAMRLVDNVERWDDSAICCRASSHRAPFNPLRHGGVLPATTALEYAAQAMGIHVALVNRAERAGSTIGYVGGLREIVLGVERLDDLPDDLRIEAVRLAEGPSSFLYRFEVHAGERAVMGGRASIFISARASE